MGKPVSKASAKTTLRQAQGKLQQAQGKLRQAQGKPLQAQGKASPKKKEANPYRLIEEACVNTLAKLQELELDFQLQSEINWCLGSYRNDGNPIGLYLMAERALTIFKAEYAAKTKGVSAPMIKVIEKAIKTR